MEALEPYRVRTESRQTLPYLAGGANLAIDLTLEVELSSTRMRAENLPPQKLSRGNLRELYWTPAQMIAHHTSNGCNLKTGDLIASGTVSGPAPDQLGCLLELTKRGANPVALPTGESRKFLEDGDEVIMRGRLGSGTGRTIGFGECRGVIIPASS